MNPTTLKIIHITAVVLSGAGFGARGLAMFSGAAWVRGRLAKTLPHVVDTVLLASALGLAWKLRLNPAASPWLTAKIVGLLIYIGLGMVALRPGRTTSVRIMAWVAALVTFSYIVSVAISKDPRGFFVVA